MNVCLSKPVSVRLGGAREATGAMGTLWIPTQEVWGSAFLKAPGDLVSASPWMEDVKGGRSPSLPHGPSPPWKGGQSGLGGGVLLGGEGSKEVGSPPSLGRGKFGAGVTGRPPSWLIRGLIDSMMKMAQTTLSLFCAAFQNELSPLPLRFTVSTAGLIEQKISPQSRALFGFAPAAGSCCRSSR